MEIQIEQLEPNQKNGQDLYDFLVLNFYPEVSLTGETELPLDIRGVSEEINHHLFKGKVFVAKEKRKNKPLKTMTNVVNSYR